MSSKSLSHDLDFKKTAPRVYFPQNRIQFPVGKKLSVQASAPGGSASPGITAPGSGGPTGPCSGQNIKKNTVCTGYPILN